MAEQLDKCVSAIFHQITQNIKQNDVQIEFKQVLLQKRQRCSNQPEYITTLIRNIAYSVETTNVIIQILKECIAQKKYVLPDRYVQMVKHAQGNIKAAMESELVPQYLNNLSRRNTTQQDLSAKAEMLYSTTKLTHDFMLVFMDIFMEPSNATFTRELFNHSQESVGTVVLNSANFHAATYFDGVIFG